MMTIQSPDGLHGSVERRVRRWRVQVRWDVQEGRAFIAADWDTPSGKEGETQWHQMIPDYPPSQMIDNPGDDCPATIQQAVWTMCDQTWRDWTSANKD